MLKRDLCHANTEVAAYSQIVSKSMENRCDRKGANPRGKSSPRVLCEETLCNVLIKWRFTPSRRRDTLVKQTRAPISPIGALSADLYPRDLIYLNTYNQPSKQETGPFVHMTNCSSSLYNIVFYT